MNRKEATYKLLENGCPAYIAGGLAGVCMGLKDGELAISALCGRHDWSVNTIETVRRHTGNDDTGDSDVETHPEEMNVTLSRWFQWAKTEADKVAV